MDDRWKLSITEPIKMAGISTGVLAKLNRDQDVSVNILEKLCSARDCKFDDIAEMSLNKLPE